jgi:hypothetical protein
MCKTLRHRITLLLLVPNVLSQSMYFLSDFLRLRAGSSRAVNPWDSGGPPRLQRKMSQDDSIHDYEGGYNGKKSGVRGKWKGNTVDLVAEANGITSNDRVGGLVCLSCFLSALLSSLSFPLAPLV